MKALRHYLSDRYNRLMNMPGKIDDVAMGFAIGVFFAFSPWLGLHTALTFVITLVLRKNFAAGILGSLVFNPFTGPFIFYLEFAVGRRLLGAEKLSLPRGMTVDFHGLKLLWHAGFDVLYPLIAGSLVLGSLMAVLSYFLLQRALQVYRAKIYLKAHP